MTAYPSAPMEFYVLVLLCGATVVLSARAVWKYLRTGREHRVIKKNLTGLPANSNTAAIMEIKTRLASRQTFRFIVLGDTHLDFSTTSSIIEHAGRHNPDFIIHTGDFVNNGTFRQYKKNIDYFEKLPLPILVCAGNHDLENYGIRCFSHLFGPLNFFFDVNGHRFIFLNNVSRTVNTDMLELPDAGYHYRLSRGLDRHLTAYIEPLLQQSSSSFIIMHMPPPVKPFDFYCFARNADTFISLMSSHAERINGVFFGHIHGFGEMVFQGVSYINAGGGSIRNIGHKQQEGIIRRYNYVLVDVGENGVSHRVCFIDK